METQLWNTSDEDLKEAAAALREGKLVAFPTETVYGLGADTLSERAARKVYLAKGRPSDNPMIVHIHSVSQLSDLTPIVSKAMQVLADDFWPGPLTMVVPKAEKIPYVVTGGLETVGVRLPGSETARKLIEYSGSYIAAPSANLSGSPSPTTANRVVEDMMGRIDGIVMGEACQIGIESTVVDLTGEIPTVLRPGYITVEELSRSLAKIGKEVVLDKHIEESQDIQKLKKMESGKESFADEFKPKSPGMKYKHYAPKAELILMLGDYDQVEDKMEKLKSEYAKKGKKVECILHGDSEEEIELEINTFFERLRKFDEDGIDIILARGHEQRKGKGFAIMNRMLKAASYKLIYVGGDYEDCDSM